MRRLHFAVFTLLLVLLPGLVSTQVEINPGGSGGSLSGANPWTGANSFWDTLFTVVDDADNTKKIAFEASGITTGTTRTFTVPNLSGTLPVLEGTNPWTGTNTFTTPIAAPNIPVTLTSTTLQSDAVIATYTAITGIAFTPDATTNYLIDCYIIYTSTAATTGINFAWDVPAAVTSIHMTGYTTTTELGANEGFIQRADNVGTPTSAAIITTEQVAVLQARLKNGANATSTTLGFTPETAASVSVLAGSTCQYRTY